MDIAVWPEWPLRFGALFHVGLALILTALAGEACRRAKLPGVSGYAAAGLLLGPMLLGWFDTTALTTYRSVLDLCLVLLLFELGIRLDVRWFRANPWVLAASLTEIALSFMLTFGALRAIGVGTALALAVAAVAVGTSPIVVMRVAAEQRASGQVTDRLLALCALNAAASVVLLKLVMGGLHGTHGGGFLALLHPLYLLVGSIACGVLIAGAYTALRKIVDPASEQGLAAIIALMLVAMPILSALRLPVVLAPLIGGALVKWFDPRPHLWPTQFGSVGGILVIVTFMLAGSAASMGQLMAGAGLAVVAILARALGKLAGVFAFGPSSGLDYRKSVALGVALMPLSVLALLQVEDVRLLYPEFGEQLQPVVLGMVVVLGLFGAIATRWALLRSRETRTEETS
ncbi:cation:proton antiporter domain-containing protein [Thauera sinica]|uniref:Cation:proton antiporter n=1 Tax=Thauera sinica TaxID=2665146 RepID=A0ABW1ANR1_9RHOO|nr:cation:proton antiporter [Thauera sp. K11]ATE59373.1 sodium:proton antiporter [Thauera sp. K11]